MGRQRQPEIRERLLAACTDEVLATGLPSGLAPLAASAGTSARMLIYHFGTRDRLLREVLSEARRRQREVFGAALAPRDEPYADTLQRAWTTLTGEQGAPYLRLFSQVHLDPVTALWPGFRAAATTDWLEPLAAGFPGLGEREALVQATAVLAVFRGLLLDREATGDLARTEAAFEVFLRRLPA